MTERASENKNIYVGHEKGEEEESREERAMNGTTKRTRR